MAGASLLALLDDVAALLDDTAILAKVAAKKTAGVVGDDLAVNAEQVSGFSPERELPVVWAVAKGSLINKAILVPAALALSALLPVLVMPLLMVGGAYLCFEGFEKVLHAVLSRGANHQLTQAVADPTIDLVALERDRIRGAIRTDFILSAEIVAISLGTVASAEFLTRALVLVVVSLVTTVLVYGVVAIIVKADDLGLAWSRRSGPLRTVGVLILRAAPVAMKALSVVGTLAMFLVGGGIIAHGVGPLHHFFEARPALWGPVLGTSASVILQVLLGLVVGGVVAGAVELGRMAFRAVRKPR